MTEINWHIYILYNDNWKLFKISIYLVLNMMNHKMFPAIQILISLSELNIVASFSLFVINLKSYSLSIMVHSALYRVNTSNCRDL